MDGFVALVLVILSAAWRALQSRAAIPVLLLLILFALWSRNSDVRALGAEIAELRERVDEKLGDADEDDQLLEDGY
jgi:hypothetical protein